MTLESFDSAILRQGLKSHSTKDTETGSLSSFPPFPRRFFEPKSNGAASSITPRRVRPIAVLPPPGFDHKTRAESQLSSESGEPPRFNANAQGNFNSSTSSNGYLNFVKARAVAGALAGDWSNSRALPNIPSFLLADIVQNLVFSTQCGTWSNEDLAEYCKGVSVASIEQQVPSNHVFNATSTPNFSHSFSAALDSRFFKQNPERSSHETRVLSSNRRRLAPTQITPDALFTAPLSWASRRTPENVEAGSSTGFQRTPGASQLIKETRSFSDHDDPSTVTGFSLFGPKPVKKDANGGDLTNILTKEMEGLWHDESLSEFDDIETAPVREKIPPPPKSSPRRRLSQRQKQIDIGKNTPEYQNYVHLVAVDARTKNHPATPDIYQEISKRNWEGQVKAWRRRLHEFDPNLDVTVPIEYE